MGAPKGSYTSRVHGGSEDAPPIVPDDFANVLKDAAQLEERLGVECVWFDSLSLVQNGWKSEASRMPNYYENAWLTLEGNSTERLKHSSDPEVFASRGTPSVHWRRWTARCRPSGLSQVRPTTSQPNRTASQAFHARLLSCIVVLTSIRSPTPRTGSHPPAVAWEASYYLARNFSSRSYTAAPDAN